MTRKIALITPWPPQHTGIADYAYDLAWGLVQMGHEVSVISELSEPKHLDGVRFLSPEWLTDETRGQFDQLIYQLGNNLFHLFQLPLLFRYPGVAHLHDMVLHHLVGDVLVSHGAPKLYRRVLAKWYGPIVAENAWQLLQDGCLIWGTKVVTNIPLFEEVVQHATALITNSKFAAGKVRSAFPYMPVKVLPQLYREVRQRRNGNEKTFDIGIFGGVDVNKRLDLIIEAALKLLHAGSPIRLHIAGNVQNECIPLMERINHSPLKDVAHVYGRVEMDDLLQLIADMDVCLALRYPTMGETSAIVMRAMQAGTPVIVNDVGWYAELPAFVPKLQPGTSDELNELAKLLAVFSLKGREYQALLGEARRYAETVCQFDSVIKDYSEFLLDASKDNSLNPVGSSGAVSDFLPCA